MVKRLVVADDHDVVRHGVRLILRARPDWQVVADAEDGHEAVERTRLHDPDLLILDISMPGKDGLGVIHDLIGSGARARILVLTMHESGELAARLRTLGASGYVVKTRAGRDLIRAIEAILGGGTFFPQPVPASPP